MLAKISTHLYFRLLWKERQNKKTADVKFKTVEKKAQRNPTHGRFLERTIICSKEHLYYSMSIRNWNFLQLINLIKIIGQPSFKCCRWFGCTSVSGSFDQSRKKTEWLDLFYWKRKMNWEAHLFLLEKETKTDKLTNQSNQATGQTNYVCLASHFPPRSFR